jgi:probable rRNA maturation factor
MVNFLIDRTWRKKVNPVLLEKAAITALKSEKPPIDCDLTIAIRNDIELQKLNLEFLGIDAPTDVLSFESGEIDPGTGRIYLGDIIISYDRAALQAKNAGHPVDNELQLLVVHGALHLLGYDHGTTDEKQKMWQLQGEILDQLDCVLNKLPDD